MTAGLESIHPKLRQHIGAIINLGQVGRDSGWDHEAIAAYLENNAAAQGAREWLVRYEIMPGVWAIPYLSPEWCDEVCKLSRELPYEVNAREDVEYQIEEQFLADTHPDLFSACVDLVAGVLMPLVRVTHQLEIEEVMSVQIAKYADNGVAHGNWHTDADSDLTAVVSLNPGEFKGGGTEIRTGLLKAREIPPLPQGYALIFCGKTTLHRGLHVEDGERLLLVHWTGVS